MFCICLHLILSVCVCECVCVCLSLSLSLSLSLYQDVSYTEAIKGILNTDGIQVLTNLLAD
jgi:hypothetical protein